MYFFLRFFSKNDGKANSPKDLKTRRKFKRYTTSKGITTIRGRSFRIMNWGFGGIAINSEDAVFQIGQIVNMDLKFKLSRSDLDINLTATVLRSYLGITAFSFPPLNQMIRGRFQKVIDDEREQLNQTEK